MLLLISWKIPEFTHISSGAFHLEFLYIYKLYIWNTDQKHQVTEGLPLLLLNRIMLYHKQSPPKSKKRGKKKPQQKPQHIQDPKKNPLLDNLPTWVSAIPMCISILDSGESHASLKPCHMLPRSQHSGLVLDSKLSQADWSLSSDFKGHCLSLWISRQVTQVYKITKRFPPHTAKQRWKKRGLHLWTEQSNYVRRIHMH